MKTRQGDFFSQADFDSDLKRYSQDYDRIEPSFDLIDGKMFITLKIWPKPTIRTIIGVEMKRSRLNISKRNSQFPAFPFLIAGLLI